MSRYLEVINGAWFSLVIIAMLVFARYVLIEYQYNQGPLRKRLEAGAALLIYFSGETIYRGMTWLYRGDFIPATRWVYVMFAVGGLISAFGALMVIRIFTPDSCGSRSWIFASISAVLLAVFSYFL